MVKDAEKYLSSPPCFLEKRVEGHHWIQCCHLTPPDPTVSIIPTSCWKIKLYYEHDSRLHCPMSKRRIIWEFRNKCKTSSNFHCKNVSDDLPQTPLPLSVQRWSLSPIYDHPARNPRQAFGARVLEQLPTHQLSSISSDTTSDIKTVVVSCPNGHDWRKKQMSSNSPWKLISEIVLEK